MTNNKLIKKKMYIIGHSKKAERLAQNQQMEYQTEMRKKLKIWEDENKTNVQSIIISPSSPDCIRFQSIIIFKQKTDEELMGKSKEDIKDSIKDNQEDKDDENSEI